MADRIYNEVLNFARAVKDDPQHQLRLSLDVFLAETDEFEIDAAREKFFLTFNPRGFLRKRA